MHERSETGETMRQLCSSREEQSIESSFVDKKKKIYSSVKLDLISFFFFSIIKIIHSCITNQEDRFVRGMIRLKLNDKPRGGNRYAIVIGERVTRVLSNCYFHAIRLKGIRFEVETRSHEQMSQNNEIQYLSIFLDLLQPLS